jgi:hypothetical protein
MWLDPPQLAAAAGAAGGVAAAVVQLENQMMYSEGTGGVREDGITCFWGHRVLADLRV